MIASSIHESLFETMLREMASTGTSLSDSVSSQTEDSRYGEISIYQVGDTELWRFRSSLETASLLLERVALEKTGKTWFGQSEAQFKEMQVQCRSCLAVMDVDPKQNRREQDMRSHCPACGEETVTY
jgi:predicted RNA-binding Zn-ribbon protein involved in translation (DUF1610 family)